MTTSLSKVRRATPFILGAFALVFWAVPASAATTVSTSTTASAPVSSVYETTPIDPGTSHDFVVGPGKQELSLDPGASTVVDMTVSNRLGETKTFRIQLEDVVGSDDLAQPATLVDSGNGPYSLKDYISVPSYSFTLANGQKAIIPVTIKVPGDSQPGDLDGSVVVSVASNGSTPAAAGQSSGSNTIVTRIGTLFFVRVNGQVNETGTLSNFSIKGDQKFFGSGPVSFDLLYNNTGSVHENPYGIIEIKNIFGSSVGTVTIDPWFALPDSLRLREVTWDSGFLFGRYTATAHINRGYGDIIDDASVTFWVIPWKIIVGIFAGIFVLVLLVRFVTSRISISVKK